MMVDSGEKVNQERRPAKAASGRALAIERVAVLPKSVSLDERQQPAGTGVRSGVEPQCAVCTASDSVPGSPDRGLRPPTCTCARCG